MLLKLKLRFCNAFWGLELCKTPKKYLNIFYKKNLILLTNEGIHQKTFGVKPHRLDPILITVNWAKMATFETYWYISHIMLWSLSLSLSLISLLYKLLDTQNTYTVLNSKLYIALYTVLYTVLYTSLYTVPYTVLYNRLYICVPVTGTPPFLHPVIRT